MVLVHYKEKPFTGIGWSEENGPRMAHEDLCSMNRSENLRIKNPGIILAGVYQAEAESLLKEALSLKVWIPAPEDLDGKKFGHFPYTYDREEHKYLSMTIAGQASRRFCRVSFKNPKAANPSGTPPQGSRRIRCLTAGP